MDKLEVSATRPAGAVLGANSGAGPDSKLGPKIGPKIGLSALLVALSFFLVVAIARAPQIKDCFEHNLDQLDACIGQNVLPSFQFGHLTPEQVLLPASVGPPVPPGSIPEVAPRLPLQLSPIITSQQTSQDQPLSDRATQNKVESEAEKMPPETVLPDTNEPANSGADEKIVRPKSPREPHKTRPTKDVFLDA